MPDSKKLILITPDGRRVSATPEEAKRLAIFNYRVESFDEALDRSVEANNEAIFTTPSQRVLAGVEGFASGISLGLTDPLISDDRTTERAHRNPGTRIGGEIVGGIAAAVLSGGTTAEESIAATGGKAIAKIASKTPAGLAARAGTSIAETVGGVKGAALGYGVEGALVGAGSALTDSELSGDPLTASSVFAHVSAGAFLGAGLGAAGEAVNLGATRLGRKLADDSLNLSDAGLRKAAGSEFDDTLSAFYKELPKEKAPSVSGVPVWKSEAGNVTDDYYEISKGTTTKYERDASWKMFDDSHYDSLRSSFADVAATSKAVNADVEGALTAAQKQSKEFYRSVQTSTEDLGAAIRTVKRSAVDLAENAAERRAIGSEFAELEESFGVMKKAIADDDPVKAMKRLERFREKIKEHSYFQGSVGAALTPSKVDGMLGAKVADALRSAEDAVKLKAVAQELAGFPKTQDEFFKMSSKRAEKLFAAIDMAGKNQEFKPGLAVIDNMMESAGIQMSGSYGQKARGLWEAGRKAEKPFVGREIPTARGKFEKMSDLPGGAPSVEFRPKQFEHTKFSKSKYGNMDAEDFYDLQAGELKAFKESFGQKDNPELLAKWKNWLDENQFVKIQSGGMEKEAAELSKVIQSGTLPENLILYRGRGFSEKVSGPGDIISSEGFVASSLNRSKAERFQRSTQGHGDMLIISAPAGSKSAYVGGVDEEILFDRGTKFTVNKITPGKFGRDIEVSIQPGGSSAAIPPKPVVPVNEWPEVLGRDEVISGSGSTSGNKSAQRSGSGSAHSLWEKAAKLGVSRYGSAFAKKAGLGIAGSAIAYEVAGNTTDALMGGAFVAGIAGAKAGIVSRLQRAVAKYGPAVGKGMKKLAPRIEPLSVRIDGTIDAEHKKDDRRGALKKRVDEIYAAGPSFRDSTFFAVQPLMARHPALAKGLHDTANTAFQGLLSFMPKDPGLAFSRLKTLWKPTDVQINVAEKALAVYHDPVGSAEAILETGAVDSVSVAALKTMYPPIYAELQSAMLNRLSDDGFLASLSYGDQARLSVLLNLPLHSSFSPRSISQTQAMYASTKRPQNPSGPGGNSSSGGRPAKMEPPTVGQSLIA